MPLVVTVHECSPGEYLASAAFKHHAELTGLIELDLLARCMYATLLSYSPRAQSCILKKRHTAFMYYAAHERLRHHIKSVLAV